MPPSPQETKGITGSVTEKEAYAFRHLAATLSGAKQWHRIFELLEEKPFLAKQADYFHGFQESGEVVEQHALPAAIGKGDWVRFLRYGNLALNLRGLAESLAEPEILRALALGGRLDLARDVAGRQASPLRRAQARAVLAAAVGPDDNLFPNLLQDIEQDLQDALPTPDSLAIIARHLGPHFASRWRGWIDQLPEEADGTGQVWTSIAESWLDRGETRSSELWEALGAIGDPRPLLGLTARIGDTDQEPIEETLERISSLFPEQASRSMAVATYLNQQVRHRPSPAMAAWERWTAGEPVSWTSDLLEACGDILQRLAPSRIETFFTGLTCPEARAALRVLDLRARPDSPRTAAALEAANRIPDGLAKLHWSLRYLESRPPEPAEEVRGQIGAVAAYLYELRYDAPPGDLRRFLDLVTRFYPRDLPRLVEDVAWSPSSRPETVLTLAKETTQIAIAEELLKHAERFAAAVSPTEAEGFRLRADLIQQAVCRLCLLRDCPKDLAAVERLLPEEEDELREMLASALAQAGFRERAEEVAEGIRDPRLKFLTRLRILPPNTINGDLLKPRALYRSVASARSLDEERLALSALLSKPYDPQDLVRRCITPIRSGDLQAQALLRLARHTLAFQRSFYEERADPAAALEIVRGSIAVETDDRLAALTPAIAALGAEMGPKEAAAEFQEASRRLAGLDTVPWQVRAEALEHLLSLIKPVFLSRPPERRALRRTTAVLETMARLPLGPRPDRALDELRSRWHEILPILVATAEGLSEQVAASIRGAMREGISACAEDGGEEARRVFDLCLAPRAERLSAAALTGAALGPSLVYLLAGREPEKALDLVRRLPLEERDGLARRLIRYGWIPDQEAGQLLSDITDLVIRKEADLWFSLRSPGSGWLESLAALIADSTVDPSAPAYSPLLDRLWQCEPDTSRNVLASALINALKGGGRERGETALRLWLHTHLAPVLGTEQPETSGRHQEAGVALESSLVLSP